MQRGHLIVSLPSDQYPPTEEEQQLLNMLLKKQQTSIELLISGTKEVLGIGALFAILNTPQVEEYIKKYIPMASRSEYSLLFVKTMLFVFFVFILKNFHLIRKQ